MKKLPIQILIGVIALLGITFIIHLMSPKPSLYKKDGAYYVYGTSEKDGSDNDVDISYLIDPRIIDSIKTPYKFIESMCATAVSNAQASCKNARTFKFRKQANLIMYMPNKSQDSCFINVSIAAIASNSFGVEANLTAFTSFNLKAEEVTHSAY